MRNILICLMVLCLCGGCAKVEENNIESDVVIDNQEENIETKEEVKEEVKEEKKEETKVTEVKEPEILVEEETSKLSNKTIGWYFMKGKDHARSTFGKELTTPADKYGAIYLMPEEGNKIYLTFDEGYENGYTGKILDTLKEKNVKAIFFITGPYLEKEKDLIQRMIDEGHQVGNHTINHPSLPSLSDKKVEDEVLDLDRKFYEEFGKSMKYLRPPMGEFSERTLSITKSLGYTNVFWSFAYRDWETDNQKGKDHAYNTVINALHPGEVMLLHAVSKDNAEALGDIIDTAREMGYEFGEL